MSGSTAGCKNMKENRLYAKIIEWSEEDQCYVGSCPGLFYGGCHGEKEGEVFAELCQVVEETIRLYKRDGKPLPPPISGTDYVWQGLRKPDDGELSMNNYQLKY